jgi:hypothetical protein
MDARPGLAAVLVAAVLLVGCSAGSSTTATDDAGRAVRPGDPEYALAQLRHSLDGDEIEPDTLEQALPNHHLELGDTGRVSSFSDALVIGTVTHVATGHGVVWRDDDDFSVVGYDDADADTRTVYVTTSVDEATGAIDADAGEVTFRVLVPSAADPQAFVEALAGLGRVAVVLHDDPNRAEAVPWRPIMNDRLIGVVADDGSLTLPALGRRHAFSGHIRTEDQLLSAAQEPVTTTTLTVP